MRIVSQKLSAWLFAAYAVIYFFGMIFLALDRVPAWGVGMGAVLLMVQGLVMLFWLTGRYGPRGLLASLFVVAIAFAVEYIGVLTGLPFGRYTYTDVLWPKLFGVVPLAICCAWLTVAPTSYEIARRLPPDNWFVRHPLITTATLVLLLDLQIETFASYVNNYWVWIDSGPYYGIPTINFVAWWLVGFVMAYVLSHTLGHGKKGNISTTDAQWNAETASEWDPRNSQQFSRPAAFVLRTMPVLMYLMSVTMFTVVNLSRGFVIPGLIGVAILAFAGRQLIRVRSGAAHTSSLHRRLD